MALSPEEVLRQNMAPMLDGIINYGRKLGEEVELRDRRAYNEKLLADQQAYEERRRADDRDYAESIHQKRRGEAVEDEQSLAERKFRRELDQKAAFHNIDISGMDNVDAAYAITQAEKAQRIELRDEAVQAEIRKLRTLDREQQLDEARKANVPNYEKLDDSERIKLTAIGRSRMKSEVEDAALSDPANRPIIENYKNLSAQYEAMSREFLKHESQPSPEEERAIQARTYMMLKSSPAWKDITVWAARYNRSPEEALMGKGIGPNGTDLQGIKVTEKMPKKISDAVSNMYLQAETEFLNNQNQQDKINSAQDRHVKMAVLTDIGRQMDQYERANPYLLRIPRYSNPISPPSQSGATQAKPGGLPLPTPGSKVPAGEVPLFGANGKPVQPEAVAGLFAQPTPPPDIFAWPQPGEQKPNQFGLYMESTPWAGGSRSLVPTQSFDVPSELQSKMEKVAPAVRGDMLQQFYENILRQTSAADRQQFPQ